MCGVRGCQNSSGFWLNDTSAGRSLSYLSVWRRRADVCVALCVVGRCRGVMHVLNKSPLALCVCVPFVYELVSCECVGKHRVRPCVETCWKWMLMGRESEPSMLLLFHVAPYRAAGCYPSPRGSLTLSTFLLLLICFLFPSPLMLQLFQHLHSILKIANKPSKVWLHEASVLKNTCQDMLKGKHFTQK